MKDVFVIADNIITSLGYTTEENHQNVRDGRCGIKNNLEMSYNGDPVYISQVDNGRLSELTEKYQIRNYTKFEQLAICSVKEALTHCDVDITSPKTGLVISTTKGNIDLFEEDKRQKYEEERIHLWRSGEVISEFFNNPNTPVIISNACISGVLAVLQGFRLLRGGHFDHVVTVGADMVSTFVVAGFQSFLSLGTEPCRPFDARRNGLTLGEGASTIILSTNKEKAGDFKIKLVEGASSDDANHISGPSRNGEGVFLAINKVLQGRTDIDYISAHGTGTPYNDNMESHGFARAGLNHVPVNSFKGYVGHTLGAAGLVESVLGFCSMKTGELYPTYGFEEYGVEEKIYVLDKLEKKEVNQFLKTASGFGGCNASLLFEKV